MFRDSYNITKGRQHKKGDKQANKLRQMMDNPINCFTCTEVLLYPDVFEMECYHHFCFKCAKKINLDSNKIKC